METKIVYQTRPTKETLAVIKNGGIQGKELRNAIKILGMRSDCSSQQLGDLLGGFEMPMYDELIAVEMKKKPDHDPAHFKKCIEANAQSIMQ